MLKSRNNLTTPAKPRADGLLSKTSNTGPLTGLGASTGIALAVALVIGLAFAGMLWLLGQEQEQAANRTRDAEMRLVNGELSSAFDQAGKFALALAETTARRATIIAALAGGDRDELMRQSQGTYAYLKAQAGIQIFGFHSKDLRYLLRMHKPEQSGDDISGFRPMIVAANRARRPQSGIEIGIAGIGVRGVAVVNQKDEMVGTVETGLDVRPILETVKATSNANLAVIILPSMTGIAVDQKTQNFGDLNLAMSTDDTLFAALLGANRLRPARDAQISTQAINGRPYAMATLPLVDFSGKFVGMTIALKETGSLEAGRLRTELWVVALCGGILAFIVFTVLFQVALHNRMRAA